MTPEEQSLFQLDVLRGESVFQLNVTELEPSLFFRAKKAAANNLDFAQLTRDLRSRNPHVIEAAGAAINRFADSPQTWLRRFVLQHLMAFSAFRSPMRAIFSLRRFAVG